MKIPKCILLLWLGCAHMGHNSHVERPPSPEGSASDSQLFTCSGSLVKVKFLELLVLSNKKSFSFFFFFLLLLWKKCAFVIKHLIFCVLKYCLKIKQILNWQLRKRTILALKNLVDFVRLGRPYRLTWLIEDASLTVSVVWALFA